MDGDADFGTVACQRLVDRIVHHFINEMVEGLDVGPADVHPRAPSDGFKTFQDLNVLFSAWYEFTFESATSSSGSFVQRYFTLTSFQYTCSPSYFAIFWDFLLEKSQP